MQMQQIEQAVRTTAKSLAPEDIRTGMYIALLHDVEEFLPSVYFHEVPGGREVELLRVASLPGDVQPMKVVEVCVPYVLVRGISGDHRTLDVRRCRLARVTARFGQAAFRAAKADRKRRKKAEAGSDGDE